MTFGAKAIPQGNTTTNFFNTFALRKGHLLRQHIHFQHIHLWERPFLKATKPFLEYFNAFALT
jgi:hypothetical protein